MTRLLLAMSTLTLTAGLAALPSFAQTGAPATTSSAAPVAATGRLVSQPYLLDLATAKKLAAAAQAAAAALNQHIAVCIMDGRGDLVLFERMDAVNPVPVGSSQGKARAVLLFGIPTSQIAAAMKSNSPVSATLKTPLAGSGDMDLRAGGLPIMKNGKMIGAIGVGGSASESDEQFAQAGVDAVTSK